MRKGPIFLYWPELLSIGSVVFFSNKIDVLVTKGDNCVLSALTPDQIKTHSQHLHDIVRGIPYDAEYPSVCKLYTFTFPLLGTKNGLLCSPSHKSSFGFKLLLLQYLTLGGTLDLLPRLPVGRGEVINSPRSDFLFCFPVSQVGLPLMGVTAVHSCLSHDF